MTDNVAMYIFNDITLIDFFLLFSSRREAEQQQKQSHGTLPATEFILCPPRLSS